MKSSKPRKLPKPRKQSDVTQPADGHFVSLGRDLQKLRDEISGLMAEWIPVCGLQDWSLESLFQLDADEVCPEASACVRVQYGYKVATFRWRLPRLLDRTTPECGGIRVRRRSRTRPRPCQRHARDDDLEC